MAFLRYRIQISLGRRVGMFLEEYSGKVKREALRIPIFTQFGIKFPQGYAVYQFDSVLEFWLLSILMVVSNARR